MKASQDRIIDGISNYVDHCIRDQNFDKVDYFSRVSELLHSEFSCECAFVDRNLNIVQRQGFVVSPRKLDAGYKSIDPSICLTSAIQVLRRQFTQASPIIATGKIRKIFDISFALGGLGEAPTYIIILKFIKVEQPKELLQDLVEHISRQLYVYEQHEDENLFYTHYISSLHKVLFSKLPSVAEHCQRVANYCKTIGGLLKLNHVEMRYLRDAALIHDIGYVQIPNELLNRPGKLTTTESMLVKKTVEESYRIVSSKTIFELESIAKIIFAHMEHYDGDGYPRGLKSHQIPRLSRILGIANAYDAMTSFRPYQKTLTMDQANEELKRCSGLKFDAAKARKGPSIKQFDPAIVSKFVQFQLEWGSL